MDALPTGTRDMRMAGLPRPARPLVATHWGLYRAMMEDGLATGLLPFDGDPAPSPIGLGMIADRLAPARILTPHVRRSVLERGEASDGTGRGREPFVPVDWETALALAAGAIERVRSSHGNGAIFGGSYGWSSAGRFHHAQSQVHRFLNCAGGYVRSVQNYSYAAGDVVLQHIIGSTQGLSHGHTPWSLIAGHAETIVMFGGAPLRNAQVNAGGVARHDVRDALLACRAAGTRFINISPIRDDASAILDAEWLPIRPNTDTALLLALAHVLIAEGRQDRAFLERCTQGYEVFAAYVAGRPDGIAKTPEWAADITGLPAQRIRDLARQMSDTRSFLMMAWALQRAEHGEQPYWAAIALSALLGGIGLPGRGFGFGYAAVAGIGGEPARIAWPSLPQGRNAISDFIPVARIVDMLLEPGDGCDYNGQRISYPDIRLVYWAGGNPFHHHQDLNRLRAAWRRPEAVIVHESWWNPLARHADIILPAATFLERNDIACSARDNFIAASHRLFDPPGLSRSDYDIFTALSERLGSAAAFTEGRDEADWIRSLYAQAQERAAASGATLPDFERFWQEGYAELPPAQPRPLLAAFREQPEENPLATPSGRIELFSERVAAFGYDDCPGHPAWLPPAEWLGAPQAAHFPLHLMSNQPSRRLHSQWDHGAHSREGKPSGPATVRLNPADAATRAIAAGDIVRVFNGRGSLLACAAPDDAIRRSVVQIETGAWFDPASENGLDRHGNPNVLTRDRGTSQLAQGPSPNSCLVDIERFEGPVPAVEAFLPPPIQTAPGKVTS